MTVIQSVVGQPSSAEIDEREHLWRTTVRDRLATIDLRSTGRLSRFPSADFRDLGDLLITDWNSPGFEGVRSKQMGAHESEALVLMTVFSGRQIVKTPSKTVVTDPGDVLIFRTSCTCNIVVPGTEHPGDLAPAHHAEPAGETRARLPDGRGASDRSNVVSGGRGRSQRIAGPHCRHDQGDTGCRHQRKRLPSVPSTAVGSVDRRPPDSGRDQGAGPRGGAQCRVQDRSSSLRCNRHHRWISCSGAPHSWRPL